MEKKILFRVDGDNVIGWGHFYRCTTIAQYIKGKHIIFCYRFLDSYLQNIVLNNNWSLQKIKEDVDIVNFIANNETVIIDGYSFEDLFFKSIKQTGAKIVFIDDFIKSNEYIDIIVNHTPNISNLEYNNYSILKYYLGLDYSLIRKVFVNNSRAKKISKLSSLFISLGGSYQIELLNKILHIVLEQNLFTRIAVLTSNKCEDLFNNSIIESYYSLDENEVYRLISSCDASIVPMSTLYMESLACNNVVIGGYYTSDQKKVYNKVKDLNYIYPIGNFNELTVDSLYQEIRRVNSKLPIVNDFKIGQKLQQMVNEIVQL